jgi:TRAP-type C4-dicarboxylate transport system permease small subunit
MSAQLPHQLAASPPARLPLLRTAQKGLRLINSLLIGSGAVALIAASIILSYSVLIRALFRAPTYWQDEAAVFLLVGATFLTCAYVQGERGHVAIEALTSLLSARVNRLRLMGVDILSLLFCSFFAWKSWTLWHEAVVDGQISSSTWGPPLWIPYSLMAAGMSLLCLQLIMQILLAITQASE